MRKFCRCSVLRQLLPLFGAFIRKELNCHGYNINECRSTFSTIFEVLIAVDEYHYFGLIFLMKGSLVEKNILRKRSSFSFDDFKNFIYANWRVCSVNYGMTIWAKWLKVIDGVYFVFFFYIGQWNFMMYMYKIFANFTVK